MVMLRALDAAGQDQPVAGPRPPDIQQPERLPVLSPFRLTVPKGKEWYLVYRAARRGERDFSAFRDWLMRAARRTDSPPDIARPSRRRR